MAFGRDTYQLREINIRVVHYFVTYSEGESDQLSAWKDMLQGFTEGLHGKVVLSITSKGRLLVFPEMNVCSHMTNREPSDKLFDPTHLFYRVKGYFKQIENEVFGLTLIYTSANERSH